VIISTDTVERDAYGRIIGNAFTPEDLAWMVKTSIEGFALGCMTAWHRWNLPPLYHSGVRFRLPPNHGNGIEMMMLPPYTYRQGWGDCDRLMIWWLCEQWAAGRPARCSTMWVGDRMHVLGRRSWDNRGQLEDPSVILGATA
jgi:hypothetical protein